MSNKEKIKFQAKHITGRLYLLPGCGKAHVLQRLMSRHIETYELSLLSELGFEVEIVGEGLTNVNDVLGFFKG
jgi:hypothetical protein